MAGRVGDPAPRVVDPVAPHRVTAAEVAVKPRGAGGGRDAEPADRKEPGDGHEDDGGHREPYRADEKDYGAEEDETRDGAGERYPGEQQDDGAGDDECQQADDLGRVGGAVVELAEEGVAGGGPLCSWACAGLTVRHCW